MIHYGMLNLAKYELHKLLKLFRDEIRDEIPMIFLEPSTAAVFRDELTELLPLNSDAKRMQSISFLLSEFIETNNLPVPSMNQKAVLHGHCHEKAVLNMNAARSVLKKMDIDFTEPQEGCCGMAGSFGFEEDHYDLSIKIGNQHLIPAVQSAEKDVLIQLELPGDVCYYNL